MSLHVSLVERAAGFQEDIHVVVSVVIPPDAHSRCTVKAEVFPCRHNASMRETASGVEVPLDAPFRGVAIDFSDVGGQQLLVTGVSVFPPERKSRQGMAWQLEPFKRAIDAIAVENTTVPRMQRHTARRNNRPARLLRSRAPWERFHHLSGCPER